MWGWNATEATRGGLKRLREVAGHGEGESGRKLGE